MPRTLRTATTISAAAAALAALLACGGGGGGGGGTPSPSGSGTTGGTTAFQVTPYVSDQAGTAANLDANLVNGWGLAYGPATPFWVANQGTGTSTVYNGLGVAPSPAVVVTIPSASAAPPKGPTGIVYNGTAAFQGDLFIFAALDGTLSGWSAGTAATLRATVTGALYTGLASATNGANPMLYAANFGAGRIDAFDAAYQAAPLSASAFQDPAIPAGYYPFNIQNAGGKLYVAWAQRDATNHPIAGAGLGYVDAFNPDGSLVAGFLLSQGPLNAPWGIAMAPAAFGPMGGALLVGNFGDGHLTAYNAATGAAMGQLTDASGAPLAIPGLWGIVAGNGGSAGLTTQIYFAAGPSGEAHGLFGTVSYGAPGQGTTMGGGGGGYGY
jgi:uncharacterized protein (TIGR03118 family)